MKKILFVLCCLSILCSSRLEAQHRISGSISSENKEALAGATFILMSQDSLFGGAVTDTKGRFELREVPAGDYTYEISMLGFQPVKQALKVDGNVSLGSILLKEDAQHLDEVVVDADRRNLVTQGAGLTTFRLSEQASRTNSVYEAFREIPKLVVDETQRKITLADGSSPLILINGINRPGYVNSLRPEDIESVEVVENPSARYRGSQSVTAVLNIKLKPKREQKYVNGNVYTKQHVEGVFGVSGLSVATGNSKSSLYLNAQHFYFHNDDGTQLEEQTSGNLYRRTEGDRRYKAQMFYASLGGDWIMNNKNYAAFGATLTTNPQKIYRQGTGIAREGESSLISYPLTLNQYIFNSYLTGDVSLFYRHTFSEDSHLDATGAFGIYSSGASGDRTETSDIYSYASLTNLDNLIKQGRLELNYDMAAADKVAFDFGANTYYSHTNIQDKILSDPAFIYKEWTEYLYASIRNKNAQKLSYMFSLGLDLVFSDADGKKNHYVNFVPSASLNYKLSDKAAFDLSYTRQRTSPYASQLNPRNTSVDSLRVRVGNPYLRPYIDNVLTLNFTWNHRSLYLAPFFTYDYITNQIEETGYRTGDIYTYTYGNISKKHQLMTGFSGRVNLSKYGNFNLQAGFKKDIQDNLPFSGNAFYVNANLYAYYKNWTLSAYLYYTSATYTSISKITSTPESEFTLGYRLPKNWQIQAGLRYFAAKDNHYATRTVGDGYVSYSKAKMTDRFLMPMIGFTFYFQNKAPYKWRQKPSLPSGGGEGGRITIGE